MMSGQKLDESPGAWTEEDQRILKKALIVFAIVEMLVLIPIVLYTLFR
jgi:hypothetical protein